MFISGNISLLGSISISNNKILNLLQSRFFLDTRRLGPSLNAPSGIASYTNGDYQFTASGTSGEKTMTHTAGDTETDAGTVDWGCVLQYPDGTLDFNTVISRSSKVFTLAYALTANGPLEVFSTHSAENGQHYSAAGVKALAEATYNLTRKNGHFYRSWWSQWASDVFDDTPWIKLSPETWQPFGGLPNNMINYDGILNVFTQLFYPFKNAKQNVSFVTDAAGEGGNLTINLNQHHVMLYVSVGISDNTLVAAGAIDVLVDASSVFTDTFDTFFRDYQIEIPSGSNEVEIRITRTTAGTTSYTVHTGAVHLIDIAALNDPTDTVIDKDHTILLVGDSWMDSAHATGASFETHLETLISADGGAGTVSNRAVGGEKASDVTVNELNGWIAADNPDVCVIHFGINDFNASVSHLDFWTNMMTLIKTCEQRGVIPLVVLQGWVASEGQAQSLVSQTAQLDIITYDYLNSRIPLLVEEWITEATTQELGNSASVVNNRSKGDVGRQVTRVNDSVVVAPDGPNPSDGWTAV